MRTEILVPASSRVVTAAEVKDYLNFGSDDEDPIISSFIDVATEAVESYTGRTLVETTYRAWSSRTGEDLIIPRWPLISIVSAFDSDSNVSEYEQFGETIKFNVPSVMIFKAGYLRPASIASNVVSLVGHGYSDGDTVIIDGTSYTVSSSSSDQFTASGAPDGNSLVGYIPEPLKMAVRKHAALQYLKGSDMEMSSEVKSEIKKLRRQIAFA